MTPESDGGCPITGYAVFRDDANNGDVNIQVNSVDDADTYFKPELSQFTITNFEANSEAQTYRVMVRAFNREGYTDSPYLSILNLGHPQDVQSPVTLLERDNNHLKVDMPLVNDHVLIISYELQIDDGFGNNYQSIAGYDTKTMQTTYTINNLEESRTYRLRYRVLNLVGWSQYSPVFYALVATVPVAPPTPVLVSATDSQISLQFGESLHNGGSEITGYELWRDSGYGTAFLKVDSYTDNSLAHTVSQGLVAGEIYTFKYRSQNIIGYSDFSVEVRLAVTLPPTKPDVPTKIGSLSTETSIYVEWAESAPTQTPILGYKLYMSAGTSEYEIIYEN